MEKMGRGEGGGEEASETERERGGERKNKDLFIHLKKMKTYGQITISFRT